MLTKDGIKRHRGLAAALLSSHQQRLAPPQRRQGIQGLCALQALSRPVSYMSLPISQDFILAPAAAGEKM